MTNTDLTYPVLGFTADLDVWGFPDVEGLTKCGPRTLGENMQARMELVDANGARWVVTSTRSIGRAGSPFTRWFRTMLTGTPQFRIQHELEPLEALSLPQVQARVCAAMQAHPVFWCEEDERERVLPQRLEEVRACTSIAGIHQVLGLDTFEAY